MPLVRIDIPQSIDESKGRAIGEVVHKAMVDVINVPAADKFQVITRHGPTALNLTPSYLGIEYSDDFILVQITLNQGRSVELKKKFYRRVVDELHELLGIRRQDVLIGLVEVAKENWSFGDGQMQYDPTSAAPAAPATN